MFTAIDEKEPAKITDKKITGYAHPIGILNLFKNHFIKTIIKIIAPKIMAALCQFVDAVTKKFTSPFVSRSSGCNLKKVTSNGIKTANAPYKITAQRCVSLAPAT